MGKYKSKYPNLPWHNTDLEDMPGEIWVDAFGYEGIYEVSNLGRVKSLSRWIYHPINGGWQVKPKIRIQALDKNGRLTIAVSKDGISKTTGVAPLIYYSFNPEVHDDNLNDEVFHKDKIQEDNRLSNLGYNKVKGKSYKISIDLGHCPHTKTMGVNYGEHSKKTAVFKDGKTIKRTCKICGKQKDQKHFPKYGDNTCNNCKYDKKLKREGKSRKNNKKVVITDSVTGEVWESNNKNKCIISANLVNRFANTGELVYPYKTSKHKNPLLVELKDK